ncbi:MAG: sigma-70 family RNA polymerase sigma factor [Kofleriaceae bacterium]|nr:sigma-70 family RNA polymerase sigma factor [Myxococcales bacterium]MCB9573561.1 sigma-70 family RNA polymerase sigma factor [Kofleriaceae bacterium]
MSPGDGESAAADVGAARAAAEARVRARHADGDLEAATTQALELYGPELFGFLQALARDDDTAAEAFSTFAEDLWKGLPRFRWESSLRTWAYALARNALHRVRRDPHRRAERNVPLSDIDQHPNLAAAVRSVTQPYLRTEIKDRFAALRDQLDPDDHALLILRIDRRMSWRDIARAMPLEGEGDDNAAVDRRAATLRKRFERAKTQLRDLATAHGILPRE